MIWHCNSNSGHPFAISNAFLVTCLTAWIDHTGFLVDVFCPLTLRSLMTEVASKWSLCRSYAESLVQTVGEVVMHEGPRFWCLFSWQSGCRRVSIGQGAPLSKKSNRLGVWRISLKVIVSMISMMWRWQILFWVSTSSRCSKGLFLPYLHRMKPCSLLPSVKPSVISAVICRGLLRTSSWRRISGSVGKRRGALPEELMVRNDPMQMTLLSRLARAGCWPRFTLP